MSSVDWLEIDIAGDAEQFPYLEMLLIELAFPGWVDLSEAQSACYRVYLGKEGSWESRLQRLLEEAKTLRLSAVPVNTIRDEDWAENWKKFYHPLEVGRTLVICPSWEDFHPEPHQIVVTLDPGSAFGTGYHATTQLCLEMLEKFLGENKEELDSLRILDLGTGSGILGISAWKLGARALWAVDEDPVAVKVALENFEINGIPLKAEGGVSGATVCESNKPNFPGLDGSFDLVVANIIAATLIELAAKLAQALKPGGTLITGGIINLRHADVRAALESAGFTWIENRIREDWYSMQFVRER
jgi:ribosomal protein L11 methyltransferase